MLHVPLDAWLGVRTIMHSVTALILLGLWLSAFLAVVWDASGGVWLTSAQGRAITAIHAWSHPLTPRFYHCVLRCHSGMAKCEMLISLELTCTSHLGNHQGPRILIWVAGLLHFSV